MRIDHVLLGVSDLDAAAQRVEREYGFRVQPGGRHEGLGTHNQIVPLRNAYLEVIAVADAEEAAGSELGRALSSRIESAGEGPMGWVVAVDDIEPVARLLGTEVTGIARQGFTARLTGMAEALAEPYLPFFIQRDPGVANPGTTGEGDAIEWIEVAGDARKLADWLGGAALPVRVVDGEPGVVAVGVGEQIVR